MCEICRDQIICRRMVRPNGIDIIGGRVIKVYEERTDGFGDGDGSICLDCEIFGDQTRAIERSTGNRSNEDLGIQFSDARWLLDFG